MPNSQNGWPVVGQAAVTDRAVHGVEFPNGWLKGDVDVIFTYLIGRLHREVEPLDKGACWGWFVKTIEGSKTISNHASGTAIDYNARAHPMGRRDTYSEAKQAKIRAILADLDGVVRWGGDYTGRPDDMHFEINKSKTAVKAVANKIRKQLEEIPVSLTDADKKWLTGQLNAGFKAIRDDLASRGFLEVKTGDKAHPDRTAGDVLRDFSKIRGVLWGDGPDTNNAKIPADAPLSRIIRAADAILDASQQPPEKA